MSDTDIPPTDRDPVEPAPPTPRNTGGHELPDAVEAAARQQFADLGIACVGRSAAPATLAAYLDAVMWSAADRASAMARAAFAAMSSCALFVLRLLDRAGLHHDILNAPYVDGTAPADVQTVIGHFKAWRDPLYRPKLGDIVIIGSPWHALIVTRVEGDRFWTTQGGERTSYPNGPECIATIPRTYHVTGGVAHFDNRPILDVGDCPTLAAACTFFAPAQLGQG